MKEELKKGESRRRGYLQGIKEEKEKCLESLHSIKNKEV